MLFQNIPARSDGQSTSQEQPREEGLDRAKHGTLAAIDEVLNAGRATGQPDATAEDIAAGLIGIFTAARPPGTRHQGKPACPASW